MASCIRIRNRKIRLGSTYDMSPQLFAASILKERGNIPTHKCTLAPLDLASPNICVFPLPQAPWKSFLHHSGHYGIYALRCVSGSDSACLGILFISSSEDTDSTPLTIEDITEFGCAERCTSALFSIYIYIYVYTPVSSSMGSLCALY